MNYVQAIRDPLLVENVANTLRDNNERDYIMFLCGIYSGRRIGDILRLRIGDVKGKEFFVISEQKTGKQLRIAVHPKLRVALKEFCKDKDPDDFLIQSREGYNKPIDRTVAYRILSKAGRKFGLENIGTHTMRKTFGYFHYLQYKNLGTLMIIFGHSSESVTKRYIGVDVEQANKTIKNLCILN